MSKLRFSNTELLAVARWMVRTRLMEAICEPGSLEAFDRGIQDDFAELTEAGQISFGEAVHADDGTISVRLHRDGYVFAFRASMTDDGPEIERRADCFHQ